jgi:ribonuclease-3
MARALDLGALLRLGRGEELTGGRHKASLLADAMEAVIAAVYVASGFAPVLTIVDRFLGDAFARAATGTLDRDYKTQLQEIAQSRLRATPRYRVIGEHGPDHSKTFEVETDLRGEVVGHGMGRSKKDAEQAAAKLALDALSRRFASPEPPQPEPARAPEAPGPPASTPAAPTPAPPAGAAPPAPTVEEAPPPARRVPKRARATAKRPSKRAAPRARKAAPAPARKGRGRGRKR